MSDFQINTHDWVYPSEAVKARAVVKDDTALYAEAVGDIEGFWGKRAADYAWFAPWTQVLDRSKAPFYRWFVDAKVNIVHNALDRHIAAGMGERVAYHWEGEPGDTRTITYQWLYDAVNQFANVLRGLGVKKGDTVAIYMGRVPEILVAMLACAKIGAPHTVVYGGFSEQALADRINDAKSRVLVTCDGAWLRGKTVNLKDIADLAVEKTPTIEHVVVYQRTGQAVAWADGRDQWWHDLMATASTSAETEVMDAEDPLFIL
ncbi:MAG: AMP-binding protein, partial [Anaerolineae bacterium]|nr:AMP-binding protein [Anaerolineae bacterium]